MMLAVILGGAGIILFCAFILAVVTTDIMSDWPGYLISASAVCFTLALGLGAAAEYRYDREMEAQGLTKHCVRDATRVISTGKTVTIVPKYDCEWRQEVMR